MHKAVDGVDQLLHLNAGKELLLLLLLALLEAAREARCLCGWLAVSNGSVRIQDKVFHILHISARTDIRNLETYHGCIKNY